MNDDIFSKRERAKQKLVPYQYDEIPEQLRNQILYVLEDVITSLQERDMFVRVWYKEWESVWNIYCRKKGLPFKKNNEEIAEEECHKIITGNDRDATFDIIEIAFRFMTEKNVPRKELVKTTNEATDELNNYFREASFGWELKNNQIRRIDSAYIDQGAVKPALDFLQGREFESANKEFLSAHEHYLNRRYGDCIINASSAFETVIKTICDGEKKTARDGKKWNYGNRVGKDLVLFLLDKDEFIPKYLRSHFEQLIPTLWSGLFPMRNNHPPGHGQGKKTEVYAYMAGYALHLAATNILLLVQIYESQKHSKVR